MWNAAANEHNTDVIFHVSDTPFPAHKFILAARSPVFRGMFNANMVESLTGRVDIIDADPEVFEQFLRFLYTGQLSGSTSKQLEILADKYQVETLVSLCRAIPPTNDEWAAQMSDWKSSLKALARHDERTSIETSFEIAGLKFLSSDPGIAYGGAEYQSHVKTTYSVRDPAEMITTKQKKVHGVFLCHFSWGRDLYLFSSTFLDYCTLPLYSTVPIGKRWQWTISSVELVLCNGDEILLRTTNMSSGWTSWEIYQMFVFRVHPSLLRGKNCVLDFIVHRVPILKSFEGQLRDSRFAQELSPAAINKEWTDVEFHVGGRIFSAHRALLVARCPALAALVPAESSPASSPAIVPITGVDPDDFKGLLSFLYTGLVETRRHYASLLEAAKTFKMDSLTHITL